MSDDVLSVEQKRDHVLAYVQLPYGSRGAYLGEHGIPRWQFRVWRAQVFADTVDSGMRPRKGLAVSLEQSALAVRLQGEVTALRQQLAQQQAEQEKLLASAQAEHDKKLAATRAELARQTKAVDALGKAIEVLHHASAGKSSKPQDGAAGQPR